MRILQREAQIQFKEVTFDEILQRVARIYVPGGTFMRILIEIIKFTFKEITFDENPAAGSSNSRSRTSLLMRILQREAQIHVQGDHV